MNLRHISFTICTKSYLAGALEWRRSLICSGSGIRGLIYLIDVQENELSKLWTEVKNISKEHADGLEDDLLCVYMEEIADNEGMRERYKTIEYCTAIKPSIFLSLAKKFPECVLHYFDPDIAIYKELAELRQFSEEHSITLIPHMTTPTNDKCKLTELDILRAGVFNFGYVGWNPKYDSGWDLIKWWQEQLKNNCRIALEEGIFTDQSWGVFFCSSPESGILYNKSYNVAYWNLHERFISRNNSWDYLVNGEELNFFHFSGYSPLESEQISIHQNRHSFIKNNVLKTLFDEYAKNLYDAGFSYWRNNYGKSDINLNATNAKQSIIFSADEKVLSIIHDPYKKPYKNLLKAAGLKIYYNFNFKYSDKILLEIEEKVVKISKEALRTKNKLLLKNKKLSSYIQKVRTSADSECRKQYSDKATSYFSAWIYWIYLFIKNSFLQLTNNKNNKPCVAYNHIMQESDIALIGYLTAETGVGESARGIVRAFEYKGGKVDLFDIRGHYARTEDVEYASRVKLKSRKNNQYKTSVLCVNADQVNVYIKSELGNIHNNSDRKIAYWYWETEKLPLEYVHDSKHFDQIWVATSFVQKAFLDSGIQCPVKVIPPALSALPEKYYNSTHFNLNIVAGRPILLSLFDATSFLGRKNPIAAIRIAQGLQRKTALRPLLVLKTTNLNLKDEIYLKSICPDLEILIINRYLSKNETLSLIKFSNCFISLHRAEGLGLSLIDAMRLGTPLIATDYSGPVDFANKENAWMVPWKYTNATNADGPYFGSQWADPIEEEAIEMLVEIITNNELRNTKVKKAKNVIEMYFSKNRISSLIEAALKS